MKKHRIVSKIIIVFAIFFLMGLDWDKIELESRAFATVIAIDKGEDENITLSLSIADIKKFGSDEGGTEYAKNIDAISLSKAIEDINNQMPNEIYYGHAKAIIISHEILNNPNSLTEVLNTLESLSDLNAKTLVLTTEKGENASEILEIKPKENSLLGLYITQFYSSKEDFKKQVNLEMLIREWRLENKASVPVAIKSSEEAMVINPVSS